MRRKHLALVMALTILAQLVLSGPVLAADTDTYSGVSVEDPENPLAAGSGEWTAERLNTGPSGYSECTTRTLKDGEILRRGIDVSQWQGTIDWKAVRSSGVEFAFIRVAYRGLGTGELYPDSTWKQNVEGALANGIRVGVYVFSQATNETMARKEAEYAASLIQGYSVTLPLVMDFEFGSYVDSSGASQPGILEKAFIDGALSKEDKAKTTAICNAFCDEAKKLGYTGMVYANKYMLNTYLNAKELKKVWLAHYTDKTDYTGDYDFWQFSSSGTISGISGSVDLDFWFDDSQVLPFQDVSRDSWSYSSILYAYQHGLINGVSATRFAPLSNTKRYEFALMLYRMEEEPAVSGSTPFTDVSGYYKDAVTWAYQNGIISGTSGTTFSPNGYITREQLIAMLYRYAEEPETDGDLSGFTDADKVSAYAKDAMCWGVETGILQGSGGKLDPRGYASRQQVAAFLTRYMLNQYS